MFSTERAACGGNKRRCTSIGGSIEVLEPRCLLADGITPSAGPQITGSPMVPINNAVVATYTIASAAGDPGTQWRAEVSWGDGSAPDKKVAPTAVPGGSFEFLDSHTYAAAGTYTVTVMIAVPGSHLPHDNTVTTKAVISSGQPTLNSIAVTPTNPSVAKGLTESFTATGTYSDGSMQNITNSVTWASATTSVATISNASGSQGVATAVGTGASSISATLSGISGSTVLTVTAAALQSIAVTPANPSIAKGITQQFKATGTYTDQTTQDLTGQVTWASAKTSVASITTAGLATGAGVGTSTISATLNGIGGSTVLTVTPAALQSIAVTPTNPSIAKGLTQQFTATGTYSDTSTQNLTGQVTWASATTSVATITAAGLATGVGRGTSTISATLSGISGSTVLTVTPAALASIAVTPADSAIVKLGTQQFTATGTYTDNSIQDVTGQVTWASATTSVATITAAGLATGQAAGQSQISATLGRISGSTVLTVIPAALVSITVTPANPSVAKGLTEQFTATATFADNSTENLTGQATWTSATPNVATVSNAAGSQGLTTTLDTGTTAIKAAFDGVTGSTVLTVSPAVLVSIAVKPASPSVAKGLTEQFTATGTYTDGSTQDISSSVTWASGTTTVAPITPAGLATALTQGTSSISATLSGKSGSTVLTVGPAALLSIAVSPVSSSIMQGTTESLTATGTYSDASTQDLTSQVTWASAATSVATINAGGLASGVSPGTSDISATLNGITGATILNVTAGPLVTVTSVQVAKNKKHMVTGITVDFSGALNATIADNVATYRLAMPGKKGSFTAKNARVVKLKSAVFSGAVDAVTLTPKKPFAVKKPVQLVVDGQPPAGLKDTFGRFIDGGHTGQPGSNAVAVINGNGISLSARALQPAVARAAVRAHVDAVHVGRKHTVKPTANGGVPRGRATRLLYGAIHPKPSRQPRAVPPSW
jgi:hypothetical protein